MRNPRQVAVVGVTGYTGLELARILLRHPALSPPVFYVRDTNGAQCLAELYSSEIATARLVANPGCYATSVILALRPLTQTNLLVPGAGVVCDCKSGASGAGKDVRRDLHFVEVDENFKAYGLFTHRHTPEILEHTGLSESQVVFSTHLLPLSRGILSTIYVSLGEPQSSADLEALSPTFYPSRPMLRTCPPATFPALPPT